ncbi:hypothetical protein DZC71_06915 [Campylobacter hepaticus]|uniref:Autotransporter outer membrane beta-barrel domain-containing protein n=1 Tax=Campylobacter hepaticus TaxID=1813019 RepID=A0A424YYQ8_9BACT|nr:hypothetical protein [Campylobacter hepaticus]RQD66737.1 hypothetical protein DZC71_06915 [Campylobacter hepaticus]RQD86227.1 hypothetical protein DZD40_06990 [Campylobacter hepaticus]
MRTNPFSSSKKIILSLTTISCLNSPALGQISGPSYAFKFNFENHNYYYYALLGYYPNTQIRINGNESTNTLYLGRYAYINQDEKVILARAASDENLIIDKIINKGIIHGALNIQNQQDINNGSINVNTIDNQGYIRNIYIGIWKENQGSIKLDSFKNSGLIYHPNDNGILFEGKDVKIGSFINTGIISGNKNDKASLSIGQGNQGNNRNDNIDINFFLNKGLIGGEHSKYGILFNGDNTDTHKDKFKINHLINQGLIYSKDNAILFNNITLKNFINTGTIEAKDQMALHISSYQATKIENFINTGTIKANNSGAITLDRQSNSQLTISNFFNKGEISGKVGIALRARTIKNLINAGNIKSTHTEAGAISVLTFYENGAHINNLINTGTIDSQGRGIIVELGTSIDFLYHAGTIKSEKDGIVFFAHGAAGNKAKIGDIIIAKDSNIKAQENAINVEIIGSGANNGKTISVGSIKVQKGAKVHGEKTGIHIGSQNGSKKSLGQLIIAGEVSGEEAIMIEGIIKANHETSKTTSHSLNDEENQAAIIIEESGKIISTNGKADIINKGTVQGHIINKSSNTISLEN